jgi:uncharacterized protein (TIGR03790 family)
VINPLWHGVASQPGQSQPPGAPPVIMVMRIDAPTSMGAKQIITSSLKAEREGLNGVIVLDSRGIPATGPQGNPGGYGFYDESIRRLARLLSERTKLPLVADDKPEVLPAGSAKSVALYCGWYSLRNYVPACDFLPGAVGFHVASLEMVSLRGQAEKGWVKGLLDDGVASTLGAVAEPYLHSFPPADEFFPLLMTGKLTLAEVYWKTAPTASWMMVMIGDPLYRPYQKNPPLEAVDLPEQLRPVLSDAVKPHAKASGP